MLRYPIPFAIAGLQTRGISSSSGDLDQPKKVANDSLPEHTCSDSYKFFHEMVLGRLR